MAFNNDVNAKQQGTQYLSAVGAWSGVDGNTAGFILTSNGTGVAPSFQANGGGTYFSLTPYIVGSDIHSQFSTIGAAITQAVADGASITTQKNIYIKPGVYNENITGHDGINLIGMDQTATIVEGIVFSSFNGDTPAVEITGTFTFDGSATAAITQMKIQNIWISATSATTVTLKGNSGSNDAWLIASNCKLQNNNVSGAFFSFDNGTAFLNTCQCIEGSTNKTFTLTGSNNGSLFCSNSIVQGSVDGSTTSTIPSGGSMTITIDDTNFTGMIDATAGSNTLEFKSQDSNHNNDVASNPLIALASTTGGGVEYRNSRISFLAANNFITNINSSITVYLQDNLIVPPNSSTFPFYTTTGTNPKINLLGNGYSMGGTDVWTDYKGIFTGFNGSTLVSIQTGVHTTDATVTTLAQVVVNELETITLKGTITAAQSDHSNAVGGDFMITARRATGGNVTLVGSVFATVNSSSAATFTCDVNTGAQTVRIRVTGVAATVYNWVTNFSYQKVLQNT